MVVRPMVVVTSHCQLLVLVDVVAAAIVVVVMFLGAFVEGTYVDF